MRVLKLECCSESVEVRVLKSVLEVRVLKSVLDVGVLK